MKGHVRVSERVNNTFGCLAGNPCSFIATPR